MEGIGSDNCGEREREERKRERYDTAISPQGEGCKTIAQLVASPSLRHSLRGAHPLLGVPRQQRAQDLARLPRHLHRPCADLLSNGGGERCWAAFVLPRLVLCILEASTTQARTCGFVTSSVQYRGSLFVRH